MRCTLTLGGVARFSAARTSSIGGCVVKVALPGGYSVANIVCRSFERYASLWLSNHEPTRPGPDLRPAGVDRRADARDLS